MAYAYVAVVLSRSYAYVLSCAFASSKNLGYI